MSKKFNIFLSGLFCAFLGGVLLVSTLLPDRDFSPLENRYLQKAPAFSLDALHNGDFVEEAEAYAADHIVGRDFWVALKAWCERLSGKQESNGSYLAAGESLINRLDVPDMDQLYKNIGHLDKLVGNVDVPVHFGLIPSAAHIWADRLPAGAPTADEQAIINDLYGRTDALTVDLSSVLAEHSGEDIYYRTDHHWTSLGAYYGYVALMNAMGLPPVSLSDYQKTTVSEEFYGTIFSSSGVRWVTPDVIDIYVPEAGKEVTSYFTDKAEPGELYVEKFLGEKDKYSYFLGGNQPLCVIKGQNTDAPKVLVVRDSYADSLAPFLSESFSEVHLFDLRYNRTSLASYVEENGIDQVVVLYSISNFATDNNLFLLSR